MRQPTRRTRALRAAAALALPFLLGPGQLACGSGERPQRIVLVTVDTLRADGLDPERMPRTFAVAERGLRFARAYAAAPTTQPTHATLFTGLHPWQHGVARNGSALADRHETLAERLRAAGWQTAAVVASFPLERRFGFAQGFDHYEQEFRHALVIERWHGEEVEGQRFYGLSGAVVKRALARLAALDGDRQFLWVHLFDPHEPYGDAAPGGALHLGQIRVRASQGTLDPPLLKLARARYDADLARLDAVLGRLFDRLERDAGRVDTHLVLTSDHGESFGEDGSFAHGFRVSPEQVHVPLALVSPGLAPALRQDVAGSRDVGRTVLGLAGVDATGFPGRDLRQGPGPGEAEAFGMTGRFGEGPELRVDGSEHPADAPRFFVAVGDALFTGDAGRVMRDDRPERTVEAARARPLMRLFADFDALRADSQAPPVDDETTREALRALGYAD
jgi:arylsulfatase A-like enzyme